MRTKANVRYIARVVRHQELPTVSAPSPATASAPAPAGHVAGTLQTNTVSCTVHHFPVNGGEAAKVTPTATTTTTATGLQGKVRKARAKRPADAAVLMRKRMSIGPEESSPTGMVPSGTTSNDALYQIDFAQLVQRNLRVLQQQATSNPIRMVMAPALVAPPLPKLVPLRVESDVSQQHPNNVTVRLPQRFSIFRSVELMAQSSRTTTRQQSTTLE